MERRVKTELGEICYTLTKKKIKNINMRIKPDGSVWVSAPHGVKVGDIDRFVTEKADFVVKAWEKFEDVTQIAPHKQEYVQGGSVYYLGEALTLEIQQGLEKLPEKCGTTLKLRVLNPDSEEEVQKAVYQFYNHHGVPLFVGLMKEYQEKMADLGIPQATLKLRDMKSRWGTCHTRKHIITLNSKLLFVPYLAIEYVVLHEFCHFIHPNHSKDFYHLVSQYMPEWKAQREELKKWSCR